MDSDNLIAIGGPLAAIIVAIISVAFNVIDRKRFYRIEQARLQSDLRKLVVERTSYLSAKYDCCNKLLEELSAINETLNLSEARLLGDQEDMDKVRDGFRESISRSAESLVKTLRDNQLAVSEDLHRTIRRDFVTGQLAAVLERLTDEKTDGLVDAIRCLRGTTDEIKDKVRKDFVSEIERLGAPGT